MQSWESTLMRFMLRSAIRGQSFSTASHLAALLRRKRPISLNLSKMSTGVEKVDSQEFKAVLTPDLLRLSAVFTKRGFDVRIIGGAVRDLLLGKTPKDIDLSTDATPEQMIELFSADGIRYYETGLQHGTLTAHINKRDFEVTTLRIDTETDGRHAKVTFTNDWKVDAERRDLTINAMSLALDGTLYDYFGGQDDLKNRVVKFVGNPRLRIEEDYLRILRYFRFYGRIAEQPDKHDQATLIIIKESAEGLRKIAVERIWVEIARILTGSHAPSLLQHMDDLNVSKCIGLPSLTKERMIEFQRAWAEHQTWNLQPVTLLCALVESANQAEDLARQWKLSNAERSLGKFVTEHRDPKPHDMPLKPYQDMLVSSSSTQVREIQRDHIVELLHYQGRHELAEEIHRWLVPNFPVTGGHLKQLGVKPGPEFGKILNSLKRIWRDSYFTASTDDLLGKVDQIRKNKV